MTFQDFQKQNAFRAKLLYYFLSNPEIAPEIEASILEERNLSPEVHKQLSDFYKKEDRMKDIKPTKLSPRLTEYFTVAAKWLLEYFDESNIDPFSQIAYETLYDIAEYSDTACLISPYCIDLFNQESLKDKNLGFNKVKAVHWINMTGDFVVEIKSNNFKLVVTNEKYKELLSKEPEVFDTEDPSEFLAALCYAEHLLKNYVHSQYRQHVKQIIDAKAATQSNSN